MPDQVTPEVAYAVLVPLGYKQLRESDGWVLYMHLEDPNQTFPLDFRDGFISVEVSLFTLEHYGENIADASAHIESMGGQYTNLA